MFWEAHGLGDIRKIVAASGGVRNECYIVNDELVARFNTRDPQFAKFRNEQVAYELLHGSDLPVPDTVLLDESRSLVPYDAIVVTRLPGVNVAESCRELSPTQVEELAREAGTCLALLHGLTFPVFGKLSALDDEPFHSWPDYFNDYARRYMAAARRQELVDSALPSRLEALLADTADLLAGVTSGVLVHSDFHYENILQIEGRLSGILDFEWSLAGDPAYDFMADDARNAMIPGVEPSFVEGYLSVRPFEDLHHRRAEIYRLFLQLETSVECAEQGDVYGARAALDAMTSLLTRVEPGAR